MEDIGASVVIGAGLLGIILVISACIAVLSIHGAVHKSVAYQRAILETLEELVADSARREKLSAVDAARPRKVDSASE